MMRRMPVHDVPPPPDSLLAERASAGEYVDAYALDLPGSVSLAAWIEAFYCTPLFRAERLILTLLTHPSSDAQARALAQGQGERFAAWRLTARREHEILLSEFSGATRSWLAVQAQHAGTRLWFGSALARLRRDGQGQPVMGGLLRTLLPLHEHYSRALLRAGAARLQR